MSKFKPGEALCHHNGGKDAKVFPFVSEIVGHYFSAKNPQDFRKKTLETLQAAQQSKLRPDEIDGSNENFPIEEPN